VANPIAGGGDPAKNEAAQARAAALVGRTISDRYRIVKLVAMGGMGAIYKGEHLLMRKQVAIKVLHPDIEDFPELVARFEREAIAGAHVNHPNVAAASDFGKFDGESYFLVLEYIEGVTLSDVLASESTLEALRAVTLVRQLAAALGAAHARGIIHRDVKPRNIMVCEPSILETAARSGDDEVVKLIDFGLAKVPVEKLSAVARDPVADGRELTNAGVVMGTVSYMAPETALGMSAVGPRSDLYSLGIIFYEMLTGKHPFDETDPRKIFAAHCAVPPPPLTTRNPSIKVPEDLERIVMRLLEKDPDKRYASADELIDALESFKTRVLAAGTLSLPRPALPRPRERDSGPGSSAGAVYVPSRTSHTVSNRGGARWAIVAGALALGGVAVGLGFFALKSTAPMTQQPAESAPAAISVSTTSAVVTIVPPPAVASASAAAASPPDDAEKQLKATSAKTPEDAAKTLTSLLAERPEAFVDRPVQEAAAAVISRLADGDAALVDPLFEKLSGGLGEAGLDILYFVAISSDTSTAATRARVQLDKREVVARGSLPMRIAYDLQRWACGRRTLLFSRAAKEGDRRALEVMKGMRPPGCEPGVGCCLPNDAALTDAISQLEARLGR
jgi:eukaryotic-like serine/threonine-protein kinase